MEEHSLFPIFADLKATKGSELRPEDKVCSICLDELNTAPTWTHTSFCCQSFHRECLENWLANRPGPCRCPTDRQLYLTKANYPEHMELVRWRILNRHLPGGLYHHRHLFSTPRPGPNQAVKLSSFLVIYYGEYFANPAAGFNEFMQIRHAETLLAKYLGQAMTTYKTNEAAIFEPATSHGRIFSVWHGFVAPQLKMEYLDNVEAVIRHWTQVNDTIRQAVREQQGAPKLED